MRSTPELVELALDIVIDCEISVSPVDAACARLQEFPRRCKCGLDGGSADFAQGLSFGARDLFFGDLRTAFEALGERLARVDSQQLRFALRLFDDCLRFGVGFAGLALIVGQKRLGLFAELTRFVEFLANRRRRGRRAFCRPTMGTR